MCILSCQWLYDVIHIGIGALLHGCGHYLVDVRDEFSAVLLAGTKGEEIYRVVIAIMHHCHWSSSSSSSSS